MKEYIQISFRDTLLEGDIRRIKELVQETGVFSRTEVEVSEELLLEGYQKGPLSYYLFLVAEWKENIAGYVCYAQIAGTIGSFEVYWLAVNKESQGAGIGKGLMLEMENVVRKVGGKRIFVGTSSRTEYAKAQRLYESLGYDRAAILEDYFNTGDHQIIFRKLLQGEQE